MHGSDISLDIQEEILVRLEVNDLIRCKSVCKSWNSFISSPGFEKSQLNNTLKKKADNNEIGDTRIFLNPYHKGEIVGSSNGLVCVCIDGELLVVNPLTRQVIMIANPTQISDHTKFSYDCMGFGYDSSIDDFKVVIGFKNTCTHKYRLLVLALKSNVWRSIRRQLNYEDVSSTGILCNGSIHWICYRKINKRLIVSFDLSKEVFKEIPSPLSPSPMRRFNIYTQYKLGTVKDRLCFFYGNSFFELKLWVMKNYDVQESESIWESVFNIGNMTFSGDIHFDMRMLEEDSGARVFGQRVLSSPESKYYFKYDEHVFVESLVSPQIGGTLKRKRKLKELKTNSNKTSEGEKCRRLDGSTSGSISTKRNEKRNNIKSFVKYDEQL